MDKTSDNSDLPDRQEAERKLLKEISEMMEIDSEGNIISLRVPLDVAANALGRYIRDFLSDEELEEILKDEPDLKGANDQQAFFAKKISIGMKLPDLSN